MSAELVHEIFNEVHKVLDDAERQGLIPSQIRGRLSHVKERFLHEAETPAEPDAGEEQVVEEEQQLEAKLATVKSHKDAEALAAELGLQLPADATKLADKVAFIAANAQAEPETPAKEGEGDSTEPPADPGAGA